MQRTESLTSEHLLNYPEDRDDMFLHDVSYQSTTVRDFTY
jgi:hypothetical protein